MLIDRLVSEVYNVLIDDIDKYWEDIVNFRLPNIKQM